jgi:hypothetical protein
LDVLVHDRAVVDRGRGAILEGDLGGLGCPAPGGLPLVLAGAAAVLAVGHERVGGRERVSNVVVELVQLHVGAERTAE